MSKIIVFVYNLYHNFITRVDQLHELLFDLQI